MKSRPPARAGDVVEAVLGPWNADGAAATPYEGWDLRVAGGLPGERARVKVDAVSRGGPVLFGHRVESLEPGPVERRRSPCAVHVRCGGCPIITAGEGQFDAKVSSALELLPALRDALVPRQEWIDSPHAFGYRHKATLLPSWNRALKLGGFARRTHEVVDQGDCAVLAPALLHARREIHDRLEPVLRAGKGAARPPGAPGPGHALRSLVLRANRQGQVLATAVGWSEAARPWLQDLLESGVGESLNGLHFQAFGGAGDRVHGPDAPERIAGARSLKEQVCGAELSLRPLAFFQVNPDVLDGIVSTLHQHLPECASAVDLYCGGGALGLALAHARPGLSVTGVERDPAAVASAQGDAQRLGLDATFLEGTPEAHRDALPAADVVLLDPPRSGLRPAAREAALSLGSSHLAYVSCHGPSLARDAEHILAAGYRIRALVPADMLPQTPHVEWVAIFER